MPELATNFFLGNISLNTNSIFIGSDNAVINPYSNFTTSDQDVKNFITASGISDDYLTCSAINELVGDLKSYNIWNKMYLIYPFVGASASSSKYNLINTGSYIAAYTGSGNPIIFNENGVTTNSASSSYINSYWFPNAVSNWSTSASLSIYSRTPQSQSYDMGTQIAGTTGNQTALIISDANFFYPGLPTDGAFRASNTDATGFYQASLSGSFIRGFKNNSMIVSGSVTVGSSFGNHSINLYIGAINDANIASAFSSRNYSYASIGGALSQTDMQNYYIAVQNFQIKLGRSV
jgi:hypothetical protein